MDIASHAERVKSPRALAEWRRGLPPEGPLPVVVTGTFDILQPGNLLAVRAAAARGPVCLLIEDDETAARHARRGAPRYRLSDRAEFMAAVRGVCAIGAVSASTAEDTLRTLAPCAWAGCPDLSSPSPIDALARDLASRRHDLPAAPGCTTDDIVEAIREGRLPVALPDGAFGPPDDASAQAAATVNGCFDVLHVGHVRFLTAAAKVGGALTVLVNDDASIRRYKGPTRPVFPLPFRAAALRALEPVCRVCSFADDEPLDLLRRLRPAVHVKGGRHEPERVRHESEILAAWGGQIRFCPLVEGYSTSDYIGAALGGGNAPASERRRP